MTLYTDAELAPPNAGPLSPLPPARMEAPNVLTPLPVPEIQPHHGRIGYRNALTAASFTATSGDETAAALLTPSTWERWRAASSGEATITATLDETATINYVGLAGYALVGASVVVQYSADDTSAFTTITTITPSDPACCMVQFEPVTALRVRLVITSVTTPELAVWYAGEVLELERPTRGGVKPAPLNRQASYSTEFSAGGNILGRVINRSGRGTSISLRNLTDSWYRSQFDPFVQSAQTTPFFYLWDPQNYPNDCIYGVASNDISPTNQGGIKRIDVAFDVEGYA